MKMVVLLAAILCMVFLIYKDIVTKRIVKVNDKVVVCDMMLKTDCGNNLFNCDNGSDFYCMKQVEVLYEIPAKKQSLLF